MLCAVVSFALLVGPVSAATNTGRLVAQATATTGTIAGTVVDTRGQGQGDTLVTLSGGGIAKTTRTKPDGSFSFVVPPGLYKVTAAKGGFQNDEADDIALAAGFTTTVRLNLTVATNDTLNVIGRSSTTVNRDPIDRGITAVQTLSSVPIQDRDNPTINSIVQELPGVTLQRGNRSSVSNLVVRGADIEARTEIDGHAVTAGSGGTFLTGLLTGNIFNSVEIEKGFGVDNTSNGESAFGTINLRTPDFTDAQHGLAKIGFDNFDGQFSQFAVTGSLLKGNRLSYVVDVATNGYRGPSSNYNGPLLSPSYEIKVAPSSGLPLAGNPGSALIGYIGDFSSGQKYQGEVYKLRYRLSDATSIWVGYVGSQASVRPQGSTYGSYEGNYTIPACYTGTTNTAASAQASLATCTAFTVNGATNVNTRYNNPSAQGFIGSTLDLYSAYPNGQQLDNEPLFEGEFRTSIKNDTLLIRPYTGTVTRINDGTNEPLNPGNTGAFNLVTNPTTCTAALPCYNSSNVTNTRLGFTNGAASGCPVIAVTATGTLPNGVPANACYTAAIDSFSGLASGAPFYQYELDRLRGTSVNYIHPFTNGVLRLGYENRSDDTYTFTYQNGPNDNIPFNAATSFPTQPAGFAAPALNVPFPAGTATTGSATLVVPPTIERNNDLSISTIYNPRENLQLAGGLYFLDNQTHFAQIDPALQNYLIQYNNAVTAYNATKPAKNATFLTLSQLPYSLVYSQQSHTHLDPHFGLAYTVTPQLTLRANGGSSQTIPYASLVAGKPSFTQPGASNNGFGSFSFKNPNLQPETTVGYDVGLDYRLPDGGVFGGDAYDYLIHNKFISLTTQNGPNVTGLGNSFTSQTLNASVDRQYGLELFARRNPLSGIVYNMALTLQRDYLDQLPNSYFQNLLLGGGTGLTTTFNGRQPQNTPYFQFFAETGYNTPRFHGVIGAQYFGENNSSNGPAYDTWYLSTRYAIVPHTFVQVSVDNLFNYTTLAGIAGAGPTNSGFYSIQTNPITGNFGGSGSQIQQVTPRTTRISLSYQF
jgi:outer membrane receptor protein involved in Fe transport